VAQVGEVDFVVVEEAEAAVVVGEEDVEEEAETVVLSQPDTRNMIARHLHLSQKL